MAMIFLNTENFANPEFLKEQVWTKSILKMMKMIQGSLCHLGIKFGVLEIPEITWKFTVL